MKCISLFCGIIFLVSSTIRHVNCSSMVNSQCVCGEANIVNHGRIVNGTPTTRNKYPWMAALFSPAGSFMCGGSIISDRTILTAGHCMFYMKNPLQSTWMLGMHNAKQPDGVKYRTIDFQLHPRFVNSTYYDVFDMSIVVVDRKIIFNQNVKPICLPSFPNSFVGNLLTVAGWGKLNEERSAPSATSLMETKVWVKSDPECRILTQKLVDFNPDSMICAYDDNTDACQGDSGGPLFAETEPNRHEIVGTVSFGDGCARPFPGIYGKVATEETINWIKNYNEYSTGNVCSDPLRSRRMMQDEFSPSYRKKGSELTDDNQERKYLYPGVYSPYGVMPYYRKQDNEQANELSDELPDEKRRLFYSPTYGVRVVPAFG